MKFQNKIIRLTVILIILCFSLSQYSLYAQQKVTLQLKWSHAFQFAGYYAALEQGYYRDAGLDVSILEANPKTDPVNDVITGKAEYGIGTSSLLLERNAGKPVVVLAVIFQHSPYELYAAPGIHHLSDLIGKRLMLEPQSEELLAYLKRKQIPIDSIHIIPHSFDANSLIEGKTDAMSGYISNEPYYFRKAQYPYQTFSPRSVGIDFYGDNLFTSELELGQHPDRVRAFRSASLKGWQYARDHKDEMIRLIIDKYSKKHTSDYLRFESNQMIPLLQPDLVEIGYMNPHRWRHIADTYAELGLLPANFPIDGFIYNAENQNFKSLYISIAIAIIVIILISIIAFYILRVNRKLAQSININKITTSALAESEELWRTTVKTSPDGIAITTVEGIVQQASDKLLELLGYNSANELIGKNIFDLIDTSYHEKTITGIERVLNSTNRGASEFLVIKKDGSRFYIESNVAAFRNSRGEITSLIHIVRDITMRMKVEKELKESEERYKSFISLLSDGVYRAEIVPPMPLGIPVENQIDYLYDHQFIAECNPSLIKMYGLTAEKDLVGKSQKELHGNSVNPVNRESLRRFITSGFRINNIFTEEINASGQKLYFSNNALGIIENNHLVRMWGTQTDITAQKQAENALRFQSEIVENIAEGVFLIRVSDDLIVYTNPTFDRMYQYEPGEIWGKHVKVVNPEGVSGVKENLHDLRRSLDENGAWSGEVLNVKKDGTLFWCHANVSRFEHTEYGCVWVAVHQDITEQKRTALEIQKLTDELEERVIERTAQLQAANDELETFSYTASHDLRTPLRALDGFANILLQDYAPKLDDEGKRLLSIIIKNANKMGFLIDDLLSFSRLGRQEIKRSKVDMNKMAESVYTELTSGNGFNKTAFHLLHIPSASGDESMLRQVWVNLIGNAIKFSSLESEPAIEIGSKTDDEETVYYVKDNGIGFDMTRAGKLFGVFQRLHSPKDFEGTGVGLAIVHRIISRHHGRVWAEGEVGKGATFYFVLKNGQ